MCASSSSCTAPEKAVAACCRRTVHATSRSSVSSVVRFSCTVLAAPNGLTRLFFLTRTVRVRRLVTFFSPSASIMRPLAIAFTKAASGSEWNIPFLSICTPTVLSIISLLASTFVGHPSCFKIALSSTGST